MTLPLQTVDYDTPGYVYLLHIEPSYQHAKHYRGFAYRPNARLAQHRAGRGARLTQVAVEAGRELILVDVQPGTRTDERRLKNQKNAPQDCPICAARPLLVLAAARRLQRARRAAPASPCATWPVWLVLSLVATAAQLVSSPDARATRQADDPAWFIPF